MKTSPPEKRGRGQPKFEPTEAERQLVESLAGLGVPHLDICLLVRDGIDRKTLERRFPRELRRGKAKANAKVAQSLFQQATAGNTTAAIWWTKTQMGWREETKVDHTSSDGSMAQPARIIIEAPAPQPAPTPTPE